MHGANAPVAGRPEHVDLQDVVGIRARVRSNRIGERSEPRPERQRLVWLTLERERNRRRLELYAGEAVFRETRRNDR